MRSIRYSAIVTKLLVVSLVAARSLAISVQADTLNVAVASNFAPTLELLTAEFELATGHTVNVISGSSGSHYAQIINGAPFDLFLSADTARPAALELEGFINSEQRRIYALGRLALWSRDAALVADLRVLSQLGAAQRLAIANPKLAPYGAAAVATLRYLNMYTLLQNQIVMGENISQTFQFVYSGSAALGLVAYAQVLAAPVSGSHVLIPDAAYAPIEQEMVLLRRSAASQALFNFLSSDAMVPILEQAGYYAPQLQHGNL